MGVLLPIVLGIVTLAEAFSTGEANLERTSKNIARMIKKVKK